jgi:ATP-binding cassette subfamily F protein 3
LFDHHTKKLKYFPGDYSNYERVCQQAALSNASQMDAAARKIKQQQKFIDEQRSKTNTKSMDENKLKQAKERANKMERIGLTQKDGHKFKTRSCGSMKNTQRTLIVKEGPVKLQALRTDPELRFKFPNFAPLGGTSGATLPFITTTDMSFSYAGQPSGPALNLDNLGSNLQQPHHDLLQRVTIQVSSSSRIAVVGANGCGKTTLLSLLHGDRAPTSGTVWRHNNLRVAYVTQHSLDALMDYVALNPVDYLCQRFSADGLSPMKARALLGSFALGGKVATQKIGTLSGGQKSRLVFATIMFHEPHVMILDEPTNHLDMESLKALCVGLDDFKGAVIIVSHNTSFISRTCKELWVMPCDGSVRVCGGTVAGDETAFHERFAHYCETLK